MHKYHSEDPFVWREDTGFSYIPVQSLFEGPQDTWKQTSAINNKNFVVGTLSTVTEEGIVHVVKGWKWSSDDGIAEIPPLEQAYGYESTRPNAINDHNVVVGMYGRNYSPSGSHADGAFVYDAENGTRSLATIDPPFFSNFGVVAHDINNSNVIVGTVSDSANVAYVYDLEKNTGKYFTGFGSSTAIPPNAVPSAINNLGIVVGVADDWERAAPEEHKNAAFLWNHDSGIVRLEDFTTLSFRSILPPEADINEAGYEIYSINDHGQITGRIFNRVHPSAFPFRVPFALYPTLTYKFEFKESVARTSGDLLVFSHHKRRDENSLSPGHFGKIVVHESSADGTTWVPLANGIDGVEIEDQAEELLIRLPEQPKVFLRSRLVDLPAAAD